MNVLVTGGLGVIGSQVATMFAERGNAVTVIDACEAPRNDWIAKRLPENVVVLRGRIEDHADHIKDIVIESDAVVHCAASTGIPYSVVNPEDDWKSNVEATRVLLEAVRAHPVPTVVLSSVKPYRVDKLPLSEDAVLDPDEPYAASKAAQSMLCLAYAHSYGLPVTVFRCSNLFGPAPCHGPRHGWLTWFCISAVIGRRIELQGTGEQTRDMLYSSDVFWACVNAIQYHEKTGGKVYNLGGGKDNRISLLDAARYITEQTRTQVIFAEPRAMDDMHVYVSFSAFRKATSWQPLVSVRAGIDMILKWAYANREELTSIYQDM